MNPLFPCVMVFLGCVALCVTGVRADPPAGDFSGTYQDPRLTVEISADGAGYGGTIRMGEQRFPLTGRVENGTLRGTFTSQGNDYSFTATRTGPDLTLITDGTTYVLKRGGNPLARPPQTQPQAPAGAEAPVLPKDSPAPPKDGPPELTAGTFTELGSTDSGKTLFISKPGVQSAETAILQTQVDLEKVFDARPMLTGAFSDAATGRRGGASFTAKIKGQDVQGFIACGADAKGSTIGVIYTRPDASAADVQTLVAALPIQTTVQTYQFPDGSGTIDLPKGWHAESTSLEKPLIIRGPDRQLATGNVALSILTPNGRTMGIYQQNVAFARQHGFPPPPSPQAAGVLVAPPCKPEEAIQTLLPQLNVIGREIISRPPRLIA